jgi:hypothetical protein
MLRNVGLLALAAVLLAGCGKKNDQNEVHLAMPNANAGVEMKAPPPPFVPPPDLIIPTNAPSPNALFSLTHSLTVAMARAAVAARFQAVRDACLKDKALHCVLTAASLSSGVQYTAALTLALPHDGVGAMEKRLMAPLAADGGTKPEITARSTALENETQRAADVERQLAQATAYRDKLEELSKRANLTVEEVLKLHEALSEAQTAAENATAAKRAAEADIRLEKMEITLSESAQPAEPAAFAHFWRDSREIFMASLAEMLLRIVNALPWLPLAALLAWLAARFLNRYRRRR